MTKAEMIERVSDYYEVQQSESKLFFEILLKKIFESLESSETLALNGLCKVQAIKADFKSDVDQVSFLMDTGEEFSFSVPGEDENRSSSLDSYFSLSFGKPVIPMKDASDNEFIIPHSVDEVRKILELKAERIIEEAREYSYQQVQESENAQEDLQDISFSFKNWKTTLTEDNSDYTETENVFAKDADTETLSAGKHSDEMADSQDIASENDEEVINETESQEPEIQVQDETFSVKEKLDEELSELTEDKIEEELSVSQDTAEVSSVEVTQEQKEEEPDEDKEAIKEAFSYAELKRARMQSYSKQRSYGGFIFAGVIMLVIGAVIYFSYYFSGSSSTQAVNNEAQNFQVIVERDFDYPVTYPYQSGMFTGFYNALNISPAGNRTSPGEMLNINFESGVPEIIDPLPSARIKGYIYKYDNMYAVQLSSWKNKSIAESETKKYLDAGYKAFIEKTQVAESGTYYRVRVGGFASVDEAEEFQKKIK